MPAGRPAIPRQMERDVKVEAGDRCTIPTCRAVPVEMAHIEPWSKVQEHAFANLIALCPTCHSRYDRGDIDRLSMKQYKANLSVLGGRYGDLEQRVLQYFADHPQFNGIPITGGMEILVSYLVRDGLLVPTEQTSGVVMSGVPSYRVYVLTDEGRAFINRWLAADPLD